MGSDSKVLVGGGFSALVHLARLSSDARRSLTWIRGSEGLSALGSGAIELFEPLQPVAASRSRQALYEATRLYAPDLPSWQEAESKWLSSLNALSEVLGWSETTELDTFRWLPHEDGTMNAVSGNWLTGAETLDTDVVGVVYCGVESEPQRMIDGWNFDSERLGLAHRWRPVSTEPARLSDGPALMDACRELANQYGALAIHRLPQGSSWFALRDELAKSHGTRLIPIGGVGGRGVAYEALERLRACFAEDMQDVRRGRVHSIRETSVGVEFGIDEARSSAAELILALGSLGARGLGLDSTAPSGSKVKFLGSMVSSGQLLGRGVIDTHRAALAGDVL